MSRKTSDVFRTSFLTMDGTFDTNNSQLYFRALQKPFNTVSGEYFSLSAAQTTDPTIRINEFAADGTFVNFGYLYDTRFNPPPGVTGTAGGTGPTGPPGGGPTGPVGPAGTGGVDGTGGGTGPTGPTGEAGPTGAAGTPGTPGTAGTAGIAGTGGSTGPPGQTGALGATGSQGPTGFTGTPGSTGPSGTTGPSGPTGPSGQPGPNPNSIVTAVAGGIGTNTLAYTLDGINWTGVGTTVCSSGCNAVAYNGSTWIAGGSGTSRLAYSSNGIAWLPATAPAITTCYAVTWSGTTYWLAGCDASSILVSTNGISWTQANNGYPFDPTAPCVGLATDGSDWVAVSNVNTNTNCVAKSSDGGTTWVTDVSASALFTGNGCNGVTYNGSDWVLGGESLPSNCPLVYSSDAITWTAGTPSGILKNVANAVTWNGSQWIATGELSVGSLTCVVTSPGGQVWTPSNPVTVAYGQALGVNDTYVLLGGRGPGSVFINYSLDGGATWVPSANGNSVLTNGCYAIAGNVVLPRAGSPVFPNSFTGPTGPSGPTGQPGTNGTNGATGDTGSPGTVIPPPLVFSGSGITTSSGTLNLGANSAYNNIVVTPGINGTVTVGGNGGTNLVVSGGVFPDPDGVGVTVRTDAASSGVMTIGSSVSNPTTLFVKDTGAAGTGFVDVAGGVYNSIALRLQGSNSQVGANQAKISTNNSASQNPTLNINNSVDGTPAIVVTTSTIQLNKLITGYLKGTTAAQPLLLDNNSAGIPGSDYGSLGPGLFTILAATTNQTSPLGQTGVQVSAMGYMSNTTQKWIGGCGFGQGLTNPTENFFISPSANFTGLIFGNAAGFNMDATYTITFIRLSGDLGI